ncbi:prenyltransferase/squalene oxidase repeat-containing protein [Micromonospora parva]|uniref:prenyltransferase/squalene oxidase repeat-containing protein n=1 Tax=Micromonospora parva TaxID=1464048 RepID=UPI0012DD36B6
MGSSDTRGISELLLPVSVDVVDRQIKAAIDLLARSYSAINDQSGGWYHDLSNQPPGPVATAVALLAFRRVGMKPPAPEASWAFLRQRQIRSDDLTLHGGWATNTTDGQPTVEATAIAVRLFGSGTFGFSSFTPDCSAALRFLAQHQNRGGGWGSLKDCPSRTTTTAQSMQAVASLCPDDPMLEAGARWLIKHQAPTGGWGERPGADSSVVHTSLALQALAACGSDLMQTSVLSAFDWLTSKITDAPGTEIHAFMETYNITAANHRKHQWRETMHHHGLALAATALLLHPHPPGQALRKCYKTILGTQLPSGEWVSRQESPAPALWPTWHCLSALLDLRSASLLRSGDTLVWLDHAVAVRRASGDTKSLSSLVRAPHTQRARLFVRRRWASVLLAAAAAVAAILAISGLLTWPNAILTLLLPVLLLVAQEAARKPPNR